MTYKVNSKWFVAPHDGEWRAFKIMNETAHCVTGHTLHPLDGSLFVSVTFEKPEVLEWFPSGLTAKVALKKARAVEREIRPLWEAAYAAELTAFNYMIAQAKAALRSSIT
jgi:hypothetical protein